MVSKFKIKAIFYGTVIFLFATIIIDSIYWYLIYVSAESFGLGNSYDSFSANIQFIIQLGRFVPAVIGALLSGYATGRVSRKFETINSGIVALLCILIQIGTEFRNDHLTLYVSLVLFSIPFMILGAEIAALKNRAHAG